MKRGQHNAITDVPGVRVGHATIRDDARGLHTGVTAIIAREDAYHFRPRASGHVLHGAGEVSGLAQVMEWGLLETPILLTSTLNVGRVLDATVEWLAEKYPEMGLEDDVLIPVVGECDDSSLSRARERAVGPLEVRAALEGATSGPVEQGAVGAGTGMVAFDFKGGIGTSSRQVVVGEGLGERGFTVGVLVNANLGFRHRLRVDGRTFEGSREADEKEFKRNARAERSIIVVVATDAPLRPDQLRRLCVRAGMGIARAGSFAGHASGEFVIGFSTTLGEARKPDGPMVYVEQLHDTFLSPFYEAVVDATEESIINALKAGRDTVGRDGRFVKGLPRV